MTDNKIDDTPDTPDTPDIPQRVTVRHSGDVVRLRGNLQPMVVEYTGRNGTSANCVWHDQTGQLHKEWFRAVMLEDYQ